MLSKVLKTILTSSAPNPTKLALVVRGDLKMSKGKTAAQCAHAAVMCYQLAVQGSAEQAAALHQWCHMGQPKIVLRVDSYEQLNELEIKANELKLVAALVRDAGRTQLDAGTATVLGLGPARASDIDKIVAHLKLL